MNSVPRYRASSITHGIAQSESASCVYANCKWLMKGQSLSCSNDNIPIMRVELQKCLHARPKAHTHVDW
jgi:hypothetical protein